MDWKDISATVGKFAPLLGTVLGGPAGAGIGAIVAAALGTEATPDAVSAALVTNPEAAVKLREIESSERVRLQEMVLENTKAELADVASARARDVALAQAGKPNKRADIMVASAAIGLISCLAVLVLYRDKVPSEAVGIISTIAGLFGGCLNSAFNFEFGSSRTSRSKDETIRNLSQ